MKKFNARGSDPVQTNDATSSRSDEPSRSTLVTLAIQRMDDCPCLDLRSASASQGASGDFEWVTLAAMKSPEVVRAVLAKAAALLSDVIDSGQDTDWESSVPHAHSLLLQLGLVVCEQPAAYDATLWDALGFAGKVRLTGRPLGVLS